MQGGIQQVLRGGGGPGGAEGCLGPLCRGGDLGALLGGCVSSLGLEGPGGPVGFQWSLALWALGGLWVWSPSSWALG